MCADRQDIGGCSAGVYTSHETAENLTIWPVVIAESRAIWEARFRVRGCPCRCCNWVRHGLVSWPKEASGSEGSCELERMDLLAGALCHELQISMGK